MTALRYEARPGAYFDSIVLLQLQRALADLPGVLDSGAVMATEVNLSLLASQGLLGDEAPVAGAEDLLVAIRADSAEEAEAAIARVDELLARRGVDTGDDEDFRPRSLATAVRQLPSARWVAVSVPGRYAAGVTEQALDHGKNVFLYSDNVSLDDEVRLKQLAESRGLMVLGPDCGTARIGGVGFGFANRVRPGKIGLVAASGTGLQTVMSHVHTLGAGVSHAIGTGGRDLSDAVGGITARQALDLLARDRNTRVIVLISKPPSAEGARRLLAAAQGTGKRVVVHFIGFASPGRRLDALRFATSLEETATLAVDLLATSPEATIVLDELRPGNRGWVRGIFCGGTLALEALQGLKIILDPLHSNLVGGGDASGVEPLADPNHSLQNTVLDLGDDALTVGRLHPMIDLDLCVRRLRQESQDPEVGTLLFDVVLGDGAHPDPASELTPVLTEIRERRPGIEMLAVVVGTDEDPQDLDSQVGRLQEAGAVVFRDVAEAVAKLAARWEPADPTADAVPQEVLESPPGVINLGLESFYTSLRDQGAEAVHVEWRPPAGGNAEMISLLAKLRKKP